MPTLVLIGLLGGLITGISPCILPVLPVVLFAGGTEARGRKSKRSRRPYAVIAGLVVSFSFCTLLGSILISALGLPDDVLRIVGLALLVALGLGLIFPRLEELLERPFARLPKPKVNPESGAFVLGLGLGLLYVPCAGPVLTAITVASASHRIGFNTVALTLSFAVGATFPLLLFALAGREIGERVTVFRRHASAVRRIGGVVMLTLAVALAFNLTDIIQRALPGYTDTLAQKVGNNPTLLPQLSDLTNDTNTGLSRCTDRASQLQSCGPAPAIKNISQWINTPGRAPIDLAALRGKVTLIDFWTYSCINCQRAIPHIQAWSTAYRNAGLQVIGVHTPEFGFERVPANVASATRRLGITYPVALDNGYTTFDNYRNRYWPAEYLIDATGQVRHLALGEGGYAETETLIRQLLSQANPGTGLPAATDVPDTTPTSTTLTPETYLNIRTLHNYTGDPLVDSKPAYYRLPATTPTNTVSLGGTWTAGENFTTGTNARLVLSYNAKDVYLVLAGEGTVTVTDPIAPTRTIPVSGTPNSYRILANPHQQAGQISLSLSPGLQAYDFTFG
jgi:cytochrome c biogenesis protein CcdA/thiol-disulfide isomerase/thioredoxin